MEEDQIRAKLIQSSSQGRTSSAMLVSDRAMPKKSAPTYFRTNEFTGTIQQLVDLYGLPRYQEANPMIFNLVTFPFLFGVMYGDIGHGTLLFLAGLWAISNADSLKRDKGMVQQLLFHGRYCITMMGFFGIYAGFMYNDFFSVGLDLFVTRYKAPAEGGEAGSIEIYEPVFDTQNAGGMGPYPFGLDPAWHGASNELQYVNSMKMKISVIVGVSQMIVGLLLRFSNAIYDGNKIDLAFECCPMMVFMLFFFGFMDYMIMYKWVTPMDDPPSIINALICMGMFQEDKNAMFGAAVPFWLMVVSALSVPMMLIPKPYLLWKQHQATLYASGGFHSNGAGGFGNGGGHGHAPSSMDEEKPNGCILDEENCHAFDLGEVVIHQIIETIEYVLGTVSHTASYLRLWALSLAHQQLSLVFFQKFILAGMGMPTPYNMIAVYILFAAWFAVTCMVLMGMDVMECFLHCLRLHWIEFQQKFFRGDGYAFEPYRVRSILDDKSD
jgi:V-type H+-transporting ATPase subunit a